MYTLKSNITHSDSTPKTISWRWW